MAPTKGKVTRGKNLEIDKDTEKFLNEIQLRPYIYDKTSTLYSNRDALGKAWQEIGATFELTGTEAKEKYTALRDKYTRIKNSMKLPSGSGRKKNKSKLEEDKKFLSSLSFLDKFTQKRRTLGNLEEPQSDANEFETSSSESDEDPTSLGTESQNPKKKTVSPATVNSQAAKKSKAKSDQFDQILKAMESQEDENDFFAASIATQLKKLSPRKAAVSRVKIQHVLVEALMAKSATDLQGPSHVEEPSLARLVNFEDY